MASWATNTLEFLRGFVSRTEIANETGLTTDLQNDILAGRYNPTGLTRGYLRNLYSRTAYAEMKNIGFSANQASRFTGYSAASVTQRMDNVQGMISALAKGGLDTKLKKSGLTLSGDAYVEAIQKMEDKVRKGFQYSKKKYEDWMDYPGDSAMYKPGWYLVDSGT